MHAVRSISPSCVLACLCLALSLPAPAAAGEGATVSGTFTADGKEVELPYVYVIALDEGFYDDSDPAWKITFVEHPLEERELDEHIWDAAYIELKITRSAAFGDEPELQVYGQDIRLSADSAGNMSGGTYPELELESTGPDRFSGRVYHTKEQQFFDHTFHYDFTFSAPISNPDAPIGDPLPEGGGEPGRAYQAWITAIHSGDLEQIKQLVPQDMRAMLDDEDAHESLEFMALMTPTEVTILGGSSDGATAVLEVEAIMEGEQVRGEITLTKQGEMWMATGSSWE
jgi:hypothetical protein